MKNTIWQTASNRIELEAIILEFKEQGVRPNIKIEAWRMDSQVINFSGHEIGDLLLEGESAGYLILSYSKFNNIYIRKSTCRTVDLKESEFTNLEISEATTDNIQMYMSSPKSITIDNSNVGEINLDLINGACNVSIHASKTGTIRATKAKITIRAISSEISGLQIRESNKIDFNLIVP